VLNAVMTASECGLETARGSAGGSQVDRSRHRAASVVGRRRWRFEASGQLPATEGKVVNPRAGSRWLFAFAALSELPLEPGTSSSLRNVVTQWSKGLANVGRDVQQFKKRDCSLSKKEPQLVVSMQPRFKDPYARALVAGPPRVVGTPGCVPAWGNPSAAGSLARQGPGSVAGYTRTSVPTVPIETVIGRY
jgi:hypothetical protein